MSRDNEIATLAGGCFWCTEAVFSELKGVLRVVSGYSGGDVPNPTYEQVCNDETGHAETVQITFDPTIITYEQILEIFFSTHDPTTLNRQGNDVGSQYRSLIFYHDETQKKIAQQVIDEITHSKIWARPIVTQIVPYKQFYEAEDYHQEFFKKNPRQPYCRAIIEPKVAKFRSHYSAMLRANS